MLNLNTNNDYPMAFTHHHNDQQFYHNLYSNVSATSPKDKNELIYKNQKVDFLNNNNNNNSGILLNESYKDGENSKRFSVNHLLKQPISSPSSSDKYNGWFILNKNKFNSKI